MPADWCWWANYEWECYGDEHSNLIEQAFLNGTKTLVLDVSGVSYKVDTSKMVQLNQVTGFKRGMWRCSEEVPAPYVLKQWTLDDIPLDLVTCAYLSIQHQKKCISCKVWKQKKESTVTFADMMLSCKNTGKEGKLKVLDPIPVINLSPGLLESDILEEEPASSEEICCVCLDGFSTKPGVRLRKCVGHWFHRPCIARACERRAKCPYCSVQYAPAVGNQPPGQMRVKRYSDKHVQGYDQAGMIKIKYVIPSGYQTASHPHPAVPYNGTIRTAYLPDTPEGNQILQLFTMAWRRRLIFTIGFSNTMGLDDFVVWNGIHHKTGFDGGSAHSFPDSGYLERVQQELSSFGITIEESV